MNDYNPPTTTRGKQRKSTDWERFWDWIIIASYAAVLLFLILLRDAS